MTPRALALAALALVVAACGAPTARLRVVVDGDGSTTPAVGTYTYDVGSTVRVTAQPAADATFTGWEGAAVGVVNPVELLVDGDVTLVARFSRGAAGPASASARTEGAPPGSIGSDLVSRGN